MLLLAAFIAMQTPKDEHDYSEIIDMFKEGQVTHFDLKAESGELRLTLKDKSEKITFSLAYPQRFLDDVKKYVSIYNV